jgi:putative membrane protein
VFPDEGEEVIDMLLLHHGGRVFDHGGLWFFRWAPVLLMLVLIAVAVWAVLRTTGRGAAVVPAPAGRVDAALEEVRLRYSRGEIDRDEFLQRTRDLGGPEPTPGSPGA